MLSLERFAAIRAAIDAEEARDEVLEAHGLLLAEWIASERRWLGALAAEVAAGETELATRYLAAFRAACPAAEPAAKELSVLVETPASTAPQPTPATTPGLTGPLALPTYLASQSHGAGSSAMAPDRALDPARVAPPAPVEISHLPDVDQTLAPTSANLRRPALPFATGPAAPSTPSPEGWAPADQSGETLPIGGSLATTPFEPRELDGWTVEKYAAFVADRRALGIEPIRRQYGVADDVVEQRVTAHFNKLLGEDGALRNRWIALVAERARQHRSRDERQ